MVLLFTLLTENLSAKKTCSKKGSVICRVYGVALGFCKVIVFLVSLSAGVDTMASYEEVLHLIRYRNWHTVSLFDRNSSSQLKDAEVHDSSTQNNFMFQKLK